jgi:hypothetical protein
MLQTQSAAAFSIEQAMQETGYRYSRHTVTQAIVAFWGSQEMAIEYLLREVAPESPYSQMTSALFHRQPEESKQKELSKLNNC